MFTTSVSTPYQLLFLSAVCVIHCWSLRAKAAFPTPFTLLSLNSLRKKEKFMDVSNVSTLLEGKGEQNENMHYDYNGTSMQCLVCYRSCTSLAVSKGLKICTVGSKNIEKHRYIYIYISVPERVLGSKPEKGCSLTGHIGKMHVCWSLKNLSWPLDSKSYLEHWCIYVWRIGFQFNPLFKTPHILAYTFLRGLHFCKFYRVMLIA